jgi:hypothetical protein
MALYASKVQTRVHTHTLTGNLNISFDNFPPFYGYLQGMILALELEKEVIHNHNGQQHWIIPCHSAEVLRHEVL